MQLTDRQEDFIIAVALTELSVTFKKANPELAEWAWQLAADRLVEHDADPYDAVDALEIRLNSWEPLRKGVGGGASGCEQKRMVIVDNLY
ncbi:hypothetical protein [Natrinema sp. 1APR25-10V2]|uniref:hypothetical protein n=1 Tax=Natrinema sp. 1APR25-10V2 TaxID=2951081 RepID=UPI002874AAAB|nr:hypothetical protein [Natrinema sp. 1APR25-10V2]MDS0477103.1 hypothetical protein [Natrinema sp. 1APR25-10V2]